MKRRDFIKTSAVAAGLAGCVKISPRLVAAGTDPSKNGATSTDNRPAEYLRRVQGDRFLPPQPVLGRPYQISPMLLAERIRRKIVPRRGFCSIAPGGSVSEAFISGNGAIISSCQVILTRSRSSSTTKACSCRGSDPWRPPIRRTSSRNCGKWCSMGNTRKRWRSCSSI